MSRRLHVFHWIILLTGVLGLLVGCGQGRSPSVSLWKPSPTATMTASPTPSATPTPTRTPTLTPTPAPFWRQSQVIPLPEGRGVQIASLSPDGTHLAVASWIGAEGGMPLRIYLWKVGDPTPMWDIQLPRVSPKRSWVDAFEWIPKYNLLGLTVREGSRWWYMLLNINTGNIDWVYTPGGSQDMKHEPMMLWIPENNELLINSPYRYMERFTLPSMAKGGRWKPSDNSKCCFFYRFARNAEQIFTLSREAYNRYYGLYAWPVSNPQNAQYFPLDIRSNGKFWDMDVNEQGEVALIYQSYAGNQNIPMSVMVFSGTTGQPLTTWKREDAYPVALTWLPGKGWAVAWDQGIWLLSLTGEKSPLLSTTDADFLDGVTASNDGNLLALYGAAWLSEGAVGVIEIWEWK